MGAKTEALKAIQDLDETSDWARILQTIYIQKIAAEGQEEIKKGEFSSHEEVKERLKTKYFSAD